MTEVSSPLPNIGIEDFAFHHSSPHSLQQSFSSPPAPPLAGHDYNFSDTVFDENGSANNADESAPDEAELTTGRCISGHSSISSFPASVSQHAALREQLRTPSRCSDLRKDHSRTGSTGSKTSLQRAEREYASAFRNPSSVLAMQMRDEDAESLSFPRRTGSAMSNRSLRSSYMSQNSPTKTFSRSNQTSPQKGSKLKKEFPLVLLHCNLLAAPSGFDTSSYGEDLLCALLPEEYRKRWTALQDRLSNAEVKTRGVLIPHPKEDYELLEERLLESLDLEKPRIRQNHFFKNSEHSVDSGFESSSQTEDESDSDNNDAPKCPDCGRKVRDGGEVARKWEIKVYAANGLMRAGAWGAAWREMEKVDVEIELWMPEEVRKEINAKLDAIATSEYESQHLRAEENFHGEQSSRIFDEREREIYGTASQPRSQEEIDGFAEEPRLQTQPQQPNQFEGIYSTRSTTKSELQLLLLHHFKATLSDWRNIFIVVLGVVTVIYAVLAASRPPSDSTVAPVVAAITDLKPVEALTTTVTSTAVWTSTVTTSQTILATTTLTTSIDLSEDYAVGENAIPTEIESDVNTSKEVFAEEDEILEEREGDSRMVEEI